MTLPVSGPISLSQVNVELDRTANAPISMNDPAVRVLFGVASGTIAMSNGHGKSNRVAIYLTVSGVNNYNIFANRGGTYVAGKSDIYVTTSGTIGSTSVADPALDTGTGWTAGDTIHLINNGTIIGCTGAKGGYGTGGNGGAGAQIWANGSPGSPGGKGGTGQTGGPALAASFPITVTNNGSLIGGAGGAGGTGGGGGGGGGGWTYDGSEQMNHRPGGAGGKGQGPAAAAAGESPGGGKGGNYGSAGARGADGWNYNTETRYGGDGGAGGVAGAVGNTGAIGNYVQGNANVSWVVTGTRTGTAA